MKDIPNDFSPETQAAIESVAFVPAVKIGFQTRRRFWEDDHAIYGGISWTDQDITQIWYPANGYHRDKGVILGAYIWDDRPGQGERFANMTPPERLRTAIAEGEHIHPGYAKEIESGVSRAWLKAPYQKGGWPRELQGAQGTPRAGRSDLLRGRPGHRPAGLARGRRASGPLGRERHQRAGHGGLEAQSPSESRSTDLCGSDWKFDAGHACAAQSRMIGQFVGSLLRGLGEQGMRAKLVGLLLLMAVALVAVAGV